MRATRRPKREANDFEILNRSAERPTRETADAFRSQAESRGAASSTAVEQHVAELARSRKSQRSRVAQKMRIRTVAELVHLCETVDVGCSSARLYTSG